VVQVTDIKSTWES